MTQLKVLHWKFHFPKFFQQEGDIICLSKKWKIICTNCSSQSNICIVKASFTVISNRNESYYAISRIYNRENVLIVDETVKLADFGSCRGIYSRQPYTEYISTRWYRAPECLLTDGYYNHKVSTSVILFIRITPKYRWISGVLDVYFLSYSVYFLCSQEKMNLIKYTKFIMFLEHLHKVYWINSKSNIDFYSQNNLKIKGMARV